MCRSSTGKCASEKAAGAKDAVDPCCRTMTANDSTSAVDKGAPTDRRTAAGLDRIVHDPLQTHLSSFEVSAKGQYPAHPWGDA